MVGDQIGEWLGVAWTSLLDGAERLLDLTIAVADATTSDHLEGAAFMTALLLGPSLVVGLLGGFWQGLRIEWRQFRGRPRVIDGDTLEIRGERIRLFAIDAPELGQPWWDSEGHEEDAGQSAKDALATLVEGKRLAVKVLREDQYRRSVAVVKVDGRDIARSMVSQGWAFASPGSKRYRRSEMSARRKRRGFWQGDVTMPWDYKTA
ncbi:MAG: thermonuclease family protein, partial [Geminicoccaceae bacterium]